MPLKLRITSQLKADGSLIYDRGKLRKFYKKLQTNLSKNNKAKLDIYIVHRGKESKKISDVSDIQLLRSSKGSITSKKFFETVREAMGESSV